MMNPKAIHESILNTIIDGIQNFPKIRLQKVRLFLKNLLMILKMGL